MLAIQERHSILLRNPTVADDTRNHKVARRMLADGVFASVALRGLTNPAPAYRTHTVDIMHTRRDLYLSITDDESRLEMLAVPVL